MNREEELDWLYRLRSEIYVYMPKEWLIPMNNALDTAIKALENQKTGHWIDHEIKTVQWVECSECHITYKYKTHYCPNCGGVLDNEGRCMYCKSKIYDLTGIKIDPNTHDAVLLKFEVNDKEIIYCARPITVSIENSISDLPRINIEFIGGNQFYNTSKPYCVIVDKNTEPVTLNEILDELKEDDADGNS